MPRMTGNRFFAEAMRAHGVSHLFYVTSIMDPAMIEVAKVGVQRVVTHGEKAAAYMADGYARASRRPGVCLAQDVGSTNLAAGVRDAHMAGSAVIAITGGQSELLRYRNAYQNAEDFAAWNAVTKANFSVDTVGRFPDLLRQAFRVATTGAPGPVHLELRGHTGQMMDAEADLDLVVEEQFTRYPALRPEADASTVRAALAALDDAAKPIIVVGGGAASSDADAEVVKLAETLSIPIATSLNARALVADDHPLAVGVPGSYSRWCANRAVAAADLVFFIGSSTGSQVTNNYAIPKIGTRVIQLDIEPEELGRTYPNVVSLCGDVKLSLQKMLAAIDKPPRQRVEWLEQVRGYVADYWAESEPLRRSDASPMRPERLCKELEEWLPTNATLVVDTFHAAIWTAQMMRMRPGQRYIRCGGSLGWAFPATIGVKAALGDQPVIGFAGDAGFYYHLAELETAARAGLNIVMVVNNNFAGGVKEKSDFLRTVNFARTAESLGCAGYRVERAQDVRAVLDRALAAQRPAVVEVITDAEVRAKPGWTP